MFVEITRLLVVLLFTVTGFWAGSSIDPGSDTALGIGAIVGCLIGYVVGGGLGRLFARAVGVIEKTVETVPPASVLTGIIGATIGAVLGAVLASPFYVFLAPGFSAPISILLVWTLGFLGLRVFTIKSEQLFEMAGLSTRPLVRSHPYDSRDGFVVDSSAIMDGGLLPFLHAGLLNEDLLIPRFVLDELQGLSDASEETRSRRAKRGLETLDVIRREGPVRVRVLDDEVPEVEQVDAKLVALARRLQLRVLTTDANLSRVAEVQGVLVTNLRKLRAEVGPEVVAGDLLKLPLTRPGKEKDQGVGYLDDGSMVVVNEGADLVGEGPQELKVTSIVPTAMGRVVFARPVVHAAQ